jgi:hypothetical protein
MFQHPDVRDIVSKRMAYDQAKAAFLSPLYLNPLLYTMAEESLDTFLLLTIADEALSDEIRTQRRAGFPGIHWGRDLPACGDEGVPLLFRQDRFNEDITCPACRAVYSESALAPTQDATAPQGD